MLLTGFRRNKGLAEDHERKSRRWVEISDGLLHITPAGMSHRDRSDPNPGKLGMICQQPPLLERDSKFACKDCGRRGADVSALCELARMGTDGG